MAQTTTALADLSGAQLFTDTDSISTPAGIKASSGVIYAIDIDNTANSAASYVKLHNLASGSVTAGTTAPDLILMVPASTRLNFPIVGGLTFDTAISSRCVTAGGTAGTTNPTSDVVLRVIYV
jgi:hypothetical protein